jgi:hypothetical protein
LIVVRDATADDRAYVLSTWVESEEDHARLPGDRDTVFAALRGKARALYDRSRVLIAAPEDDAITVLAWLAVDRTASVVHYAYTRRQLRRQGLQRDLVAASALDTLTVTTSRPRRAETLRATFAPLMGWMLACAGEETTK